MRQLNGITLLLPYRFTNSCPRKSEEVFVLVKCVICFVRKRKSTAGYLTNANALTFGKRLSRSVCSTSQPDYRLVVLPSV